MAQRGMLPKIRKTAQAAQPVARPTIRPVRVTKAPPPPAPPRKFPSGVAPRGSHEAYPEQQAYADPPETREPTTKNGYEDPPTMSAHGAPMPKANANANAVGPSSSSIRFDDETQMRQPDGRLIAASRHPAPVIAESRQDDETMARSQAPVTQPYFPPQDEHTHARNDHHLQPLPAPQQPDIYDSLPSLEIRRPYDTYEREFEERDPATQYGRRGEERHDAREHGEHAEHYPAPLRDEHHDSYDHAEHAPETQHMPQAHGREGSGARERPRMQSSQRRRNEYEDSSEQHHAHHEPAPVAYEPPPATRKAYEPAPSPVPQARTSEPAPRYEEPMIPPAPRVPAGFIVGVQPLRQPQAQPHENNESFPPYAPHVQPPAPSPRGTYEPMQPMHAPAHVGAMHQSPMHGTPSMHQGLHQQPAMVHRGHPAMPYAQPAWSRPQPQIPTHPGQRGPVGHQLQDQPSATSRTLRFAWFVFGVAFGIGFTFFASGVVPGLKREEPSPTATAAPSATFPPAAPILSNAPPPVQAPPVQAAPPVAEAQAAPVQAPVQAPAVQAPPPVLAPPPADNTALAGVTPGQLPQAKAAQTAAPPPAPAQARVASAPAPAPRTTRRASAPSGGGSSAPRALPNSGSVEASDGEGGGAVFGSSAFSSSSSSSSAPAKTAAVPSDLFGAALNP